MVAITMDQPSDARNKRIAPTPIMRQSPHGLHTVRLNVRLVANVQTVIVAQFVKRRMVRIVTGSNGIEIVLSNVRTNERTNKQ